MMELKIHKSNFSLYLLQIYVFTIIAWDYEIYYQIPLLLLFLFSLLRYKHIENAIQTSSFFHGYFFMMLYFILQYVLGLTVSRSDSLAYLVTGLLNLSAIVCFASVIDKTWKIERVLKTIVFSSGIVSLYNVIKNINIIFYGGLASHCYKLFFSNPTYSHSTIPMFCAFSVMCLVYFCMKNRWKPSDVILIAYFSIYIILSSSRNALIFLIFGLLIYPFLFSGDKEKFINRLFKIVILAIAVVATITLVIKVPYLYNIIGFRVQDVLNGFLGGDFSESSAMSRNTMLITGINLIKQNWLLGCGLNTFRTFPGSFGTWSHNQYIESMVSGGIIALCGYFFFNIKSVFLLRKEFSKLGGFSLCLMMYMLVCNMFNVCYMDRFICLIYGIVDAYIRIERRNGNVGNDFHSHI